VESLNMLPLQETEKITQQPMLNLAADLMAKYFQYVLG
jgi:hypothetical protein